MSHQHLSHQRFFFGPHLSLNLRQPHLHELPSADLDEHRQLLKVGWVFLIVLVQLHNFLIGTLVLVLAEISIFFLSRNLFFSSSSKCVEHALFTRLFALSLFFFILLALSFPLSFSVRLSHPSPLCLSLGDHTQHFLFPVGVMSLLHKQSALICQHSSWRFIKIQHAPEKDVCVPHACPCTCTNSKPPLSPPAPFCYRRTHAEHLKSFTGANTCVSTVLDCDHDEGEYVKCKGILLQSSLKLPRHFLIFLGKL